MFAQSFKGSPTDLQMCVLHFFIIGILRNLKYFGVLDVNKKSFLFLKKATKQSSYAVCVRETKRPNKVQWCHGQASDFRSQCTRFCAYNSRSRLSEPRLCLAEFLALFLPVGVHQSRAKVRPLLRVGRIGWDLYSDSGGTRLCWEVRRKIALATVRSMYGRLKIEQEKKNPFRYQIMLMKVIRFRFLFSCALVLVSACFKWAKTLD